ncbi:MAG: DNA repair protein RecO [Burkholderiales bacterium]|uniref:DNA repair protein RecO n=1 Tax=Caldimonas thermodepolymerans TaxID=215580 RepID=UPI000DB87227|nr:DNA repair protein RecO [Caldimonas thermodepolymerans]MBX6393117.1 DNA repair protein RecO [Burkholderiales bacterium]PZN04513.1 MAG: DNA repair protein RecO [Pseudomonadota bacterium]
MEQGSRRRVENERAYVLHTWPYSETSLLVEIFSRGYGRLPLLAKGVRRPRSSLRGLLMAFQPLSLGWSGRGEVRTLNRCEWVGGLPLLKGDALLCGFYCNELLMRLLPREDPHEALFDHYEATLAQLQHAEDLERVLRAFERTLLKELGYGLTLDRDAETGGPIDPEAFYDYEPDRGPVPSRGEGRLRLRGRTLLAIANEDYSDPGTLQQYKQLMRLLINHRLDQQPLHSRNVYRELQQL